MIRRVSVPLLILALVLAVGLLSYQYSATSPQSQDASQTDTVFDRPPLSAGPQATSAPAPHAHVPMSALPKEVAATWGLLTSNGPFPYAQDGAVFGNVERRLPIRHRGYYHEYTVKTPGARDRGARRIVVGKDLDVWYTANHYDSFVRVDVDA